MTLPVLLILVVLFVGVAIIAERELARRRRAGETVSVRGISEDVGDSINRAARDVQDTVTRVVRPPSVTLVAPFKDWVDSDLKDEPQLRTWLLGLPEEAIRALVIQLDEFCQELSIELAWLVSGDLNVEPSTRAVVRDVVVTYCKMCLKAVQIQPDVSAFRVYQDILAGLERGERQPLAQQLLAKLRENNLAEPPPPNLVLATAPDRRRYAVETIREAATRDRTKFKAIWQEVLTQEAAAAQSNNANAATSTPSPTTTSTA
ncbi:MAG: hypothetical protein GYB67_07035 [Chloroflexi bacterium]|nr:hypothetical protein [Chloroflexota bacterium]